MLQGVTVLTIGHLSWSMKAVCRGIWGPIGKVSNALIRSSRMSSDDEEVEFWDEIKCFRAPTGVGSVCAAAWWPRQASDLLLLCHQQDRLPVGLSESDEEEAGDLQLTLLHELPPHSPQHQAALQLAMQLRQSLLVRQRCCLA